LFHAHTIIFGIFDKAHLFGAIAKILNLSEPHQAISNEQTEQNWQLLSKNN
jgi:hypothetical protein